MDTPALSLEARWLRKSRASVPGRDGSGEITQEDLAAAITAATGWNITRDRYSKYESGSLPIGPKVLGHFRDYWRSRGVEGPEAAPEPTGATESDDPLVAALRDQTRAINALVAQLDTFVGPLGEVVADLLREKVLEASGRIRSGATSS